MSRTSQQLLTLCSISLILVFSSLPLQAGNKHGKGNGPPPWAPAHGYYKNKGKKHKTKHAYNRYDDDDRYAEVSVSDPTPPPAEVLSCDRSGFSHAEIGGAVGGVVGGILGSNIGKGNGKTLATIAGTLIGATIGSNIGGSMDSSDQYCAGQAFDTAPDQRTVAWNNPDTHSTYRVTPNNSYTSNDGRYCREYSSATVINGRQENVTGTACRNAEGNWQLMN
jgi:surface antigen